MTQPPEIDIQKKTLENSFLNKSHNNDYILRST